MAEVEAKTDIPLTERETMSYIIGIDPGRAYTGICVWDIVAKKIVYNGTFGMPLGEARKGAKWNPSWYRLSELNDFLRDELKDFRFSAVGLIEDYPYPGKMNKEDFENMDRSPLQFAQTHGVIYSAMAAMQIPFIKVTPTQMKYFVTGYGHADKRQVIKHIFELYKEPLLDEHQFDALCLCHMGRYITVFAVDPSLFKEDGYEYMTINSLLMDNRHAGFKREVIKRCTDMPF